MALSCYDCGLYYGGVGWADFVVPDSVWRQISPTGNESGILCANCMVRRAERIGVQCVGQFTSGPFADHGWSKPAE